MLVLGIGIGIVVVCGVGLALAPSTASRQRVDTSIERRDAETQGRWARVVWAAGPLRSEVDLADTHLRELERRWKETGSAEDEAALLRERVRLGDLSRAAFELAGLLTQAPQRETDLVDLLESLEERDQVASQRACLAVARSLGEAWESDPVWFGSLGPLLDVAEACLVSPSPSQTQRLRETIPMPIGGSKRARQLRNVALSAACHVLGDFESEALLKFDHRSEALGRRVFALACLRVLTLEGVLAALKDEVVPWLLGYRDPVQDRVEARRRESQP